MIIESATIHVVPGQEEQFLASLERGRQVLAEATGWRGLRVQRGIERPSVFLLLIEWETLEDHTVGFRGSELFTRWREAIGPHFAQPPEVEHWAPQ